MLSRIPYGLMNSKIYLDHHQSSNTNIGYDAYLFRLGSAKGILPKAFAMKLQKKFGAWMKQIKVKILNVTKKILSEKHFLKIIKISVTRGSFKPTTIIGNRVHRIVK